MKTINSYTVTQINNHAKSILEKKLEKVYVKGEVSSFKKYESGHAYFILKDFSSEISCTIFNYNYPYQLQDGQEITTFGNISIYAMKGKFQLIVNDVYIDGIGQNLLFLKKLKSKLTKEGLFDLIHKKKIPLYPFKVGIVTSIDGAVINDILNILNRRAPFLEILISNTLVQGKDAPSDIIESLTKFDSENKVDVIILARGGGSFEDLMAFNDENLVRFIYNLTTPIITAVGHESDYTLVDLVSDLRASTPSEAAEICCTSKTDLVQYINNIHFSIINTVKNELNQKNNSIKNINLSLKRSLATTIIDKNSTYVQSISVRIFDKINSLFNIYRQNVLHSKKLLKKNNINSLKKIGFSIVKKNKKIINSENKLNFDDNISIEFYKGKIKAKVIK
tara:strand:+ start:3297 stop:4475 length:1179 start_codon:yes stop_codon:yes gene_type:complete